MEDTLIRNLLDAIRTLIVNESGSYILMRKHLSYLNLKMIEKL
jgi:hypothetical protein